MRLELSVGHEELRRHPIAFRAGGADSDDQPDDEEPERSCDHRVSIRPWTRAYKVCTGTPLRSSSSSSPLEHPNPRALSVLRQNSVRREVVDLPALIRRRSWFDDHPPAPALRLLPFLCGGHRQLALENLALHQQLAVYKRTAPLLSPGSHASRARQGCAGRQARQLPEAGRIVEIPEVGGLHHRYVRQAA